MNKFNRDYHAAARNTKHLMEISERISVFHLNCANIISELNFVLSNVMSNNGWYRCFFSQYYVKFKRKDVVCPRLYP